MAEVLSGDFIGTWQGNLNIGNGTKLPLVFRFHQHDGTYHGTLDCPEQWQTGIQFDSVKVTAENKVEAKLEKLEAVFEGILQDNAAIQGKWKQAGMIFEIALQSSDEFGPGRPQEPHAPFPYIAEEVRIRFAHNELAGTLTLPQGRNKVPAVILVQGSGPHDRDATSSSHRPFLLLSDFLSRNGVAVLRCDRRGCYQSGGDFGTATSRDFADDVAAQYRFLKTRSEIDSSKIGYIGHSEGGMISLMAACDVEDAAFIVTMGGPSINGEKILYSQMAAIARGQGQSQEKIDKALTISKATYAIIIEESDNDKAIARIKEARRNLHADDLHEDKEKSEALVESTLRRLTAPWYRFFLVHDPRTSLSMLSCPILAVHGDKDTQVIAEENFAAFEETVKMSGNDKATTHLFPGLNHMFQTCHSGLPEEYGRLEETIAPYVLQYISDWIMKQI